MAKPGKYDTLVKTLKKDVVADLPYQDRINATKELCQRCSLPTPTDLPCIDAASGEEHPNHFVWSQLDAMTLGEVYEGLRLEKQAQEAAEKALNLKIEAVTQLLVASQDRGEDGWGKYGVKDNALRLENGATIRVHVEPYGQVKDKEAFRLWCMAPAEVCRTCGGGRLDDYHSDTPDGSNPSVHRFNPGGGYERQLQLWPSVMNALAKERALNGEPNPDGVEVFRKETVKFIAAGGKDE